MSSPNNSRYETYGTGKLTWKCGRCAYADHFLGTKRSIYEATITEEPDDSANIKVAILDTGLDLGHPDIQANGERIKEIRSWLYTPDGVKLTKPNDPCGHGTHVTGLLLDVAPDCDVYVAQIADSRESRPLSAHRIVRVCQRTYCTIRQPR